MECALVGAADFNKEHFSAQAYGMVIAVDAGWQSCVEAGVVPTCAIGDFDSLGFVPEGVEVVQYSSEKDESDMELALLYAQEHGVREVVLYGAFGQRFDHSFANAMLMGQFAQRGMHVFAIGTDFASVALAGMPTEHSTDVSANANTAANTASNTLSFEAFNPTNLDGSYAPYISCFAVGGAVEGLNISGLKYEVEDFQLSPLRSRGLSNQFIGKLARIQVSKGTLLVTMPLGAYNCISREGN